MKMDQIMNQLNVNRVNPLFYGFLFTKPLFEDSWAHESHFGSEEHKNLGRLSNGSTQDKLLFQVMTAPLSEALLLPFATACRFRSRHCTGSNCCAGTAPHVRWSACSSVQPYEQIERLRLSCANVRTHQNPAETLQNPIVWTTNHRDGRRDAAVTFPWNEFVPPVRPGRVTGLVPVLFSPVPILVSKSAQSSQTAQRLQTNRWTTDSWCRTSPNKGRPPAQWFQPVFLGV